MINRSKNQLPIINIAKNFILNFQVLVVSDFTIRLIIEVCFVLFILSKDNQYYETFPNTYQQRFSAVILLT